MCIVYQEIQALPVGRAFFIHYLTEQLLTSESKQNSNNNKKPNVGHVKKGKKQHRKKQKKPKQDIEIKIDWDCDNEDYYALLGIKHLEMNISQDDLKKACMLSLH